MSFGSRKKTEIRERSGYFCQVCGAWHQPHDGSPGSCLDAHSLDRTHTDSGLAVCGHLADSDNCHNRLHRTTNDPVELRKVSLTAVQLNGLAVTYQMLAAGEPEQRIRRVVGRICDV